MKYVELDKTPMGNLRITWADGVTDGDKAELREMAEREGYFFAEIDALDYHLCNGWTWVRPDEIGALVSDTCPIITDDARYDDSNNLLEVSKVYVDSNYAIRSFLDDLLDKGEAILTGVD